MSQVWHRITGLCKNGRLVPDRKDRLDAIIQELSGYRFELALRRERKNRTLPQNAKLHVLVDLIAKETGDSELYVKRLATLSAIGLERGLVEEEILGRKIHEVRHTSDLSTAECSLVMEWLLDKCRFLDLTLPADEEIEVLP